jgi:hypothetical protein
MSRKTLGSYGLFFVALIRHFTLLLVLPPMSARQLTRHTVLVMAGLRVLGI